MITIDETLIKNFILGCLWVEFTWEFYLSIRQYRKELSITDVPKELKSVLKSSTFQKSKDYSMAKIKFQFIKDIYGIILSTFVIYTDMLAFFWKYSDGINTFGGEVLTSCIWLSILTTLMMFLDMPFTLYFTFVLEEKYGFNKQTGKFFAFDKLKQYLVSQIILLMISSIAIVIVQNGGDYFFVWLWLAICVFSLIFMTIYPAFIAPLFDKYTPLPEGELRTDIEKLASDLKFPLTELYIVEGSKRSAHSNAYFYGWFKSKRIVLYDTLLENKEGTGCKNDEILAILCHELGHWSYNHVFKNIIIIQVNLLLLFTVFSYMFKSPLIYKSVGFDDSQPVLVGLYVVIMYIMSPYNTLLSFLTTCMSRKFEFQADNFAVELNKGEPLQRALLQLNKDNLTFPVYDDLYSAYNHSHPPLLERLAAIKNASKKEK